MLFSFKKGKNATESQKKKKKKICEVAGEGAVTDQTCQVVCEVSCCRFLAGHAPWPGRPADVDNEHIETLTENSQCSATQERADILRISRSVKLLVKMKMCLSFRQKN